MSAPATARSTARPLAATKYETRNPNPDFQDAKKTLRSTLDELVSYFGPSDFGFSAEVLRNSDLKKLASKTGSFAVVKRRAHAASNGSIDVTSHADKIAGQSGHAKSSDGINGID